MSKNDNHIKEEGISFHALSAGLAVVGFLYAIIEFSFSFPIANNFYVNTIIFILLGFLTAVSFYFSLFLAVKFTDERVLFHGDEMRTSVAILILIVCAILAVGFMWSGAHLLRLIF